MKVFLLLEREIEEWARIQSHYIELLKAKRFQLNTSKNMGYIVFIIIFRFATALILESLIV